MLLLLPGAYFALNPVAALPDAQQALIALMPYVLGLTVAMLAIGFRRSRILLAALNLCVAYALIRCGLQTSLDNPDAYVLFSALSLLLPMNTALIALFNERGVFTPTGLRQLALLTPGYLLILLLDAGNWLGYLLPWLPMSMLEMLYLETYLSQAAAWIFGLSLLPVLVSLYLRRAPADAALLASLVAAVVMLLWFDRPLISALFVSAALLVLATAVIQSSYSMAFIDELTEIPGRRALYTKINTLGRVYTIAMIDIDRFKQFNDRYGHDTGDQVLRMVAAKIAKVQGGGRAYRYGGEEFTILFPGKTEPQARLYLEEVREVVANYPMRIRSPQRPEDTKQGKQQRNQVDASEVVKVTISIGFCEKAEHHQDADEVIKEADQALYSAKKAGRNCTRSAGEKGSRGMASYRKSNV
ncbi:diguanylate cyclase [Pontibacter sp. JAM-7]|uniref:GGDEF domain-containing protein n=1 Tax=Pontibacter sp. JAM-7 TaxID=3366581 RepID=UPI003AF8256E